MTRTTFFKHFELLADQPDAVAKMRELILQLAVEGRLIPQDPKDKPASELLERSAAQQKRFIKEGRAKAYEAPAVEEADKFTRLPKGWAWARLKQLGYFCVGATPSMNKSVYWGDGIPWVTPKDMRTLRVRGSEMSVTPLALKETRLRLLPKNSVLIVGRSGILKRLLPVAVTEIECVVNQDMKVLVPFLPELASFIQLMLRGHQAFILERLVKGGMTVQSLKYEEFEAQPFPLPPLAEQRRIVAKVDELMALCDELEQRQQARQHARGQLQQSALHHLLAAREPQTFAAAWQRVCDHFHLLHDTPDAIPQLHQAILHLAVQGRLVPQNPKDESAQSLFKRIMSETKRASDLGEIDLSRVPFDPPNSWLWVKAEDLCRPSSIITYGVLKPVWAEKGVPTIRVQDIQDGNIVVEGIGQCSHERAAKFSKTTLEPGDLLIAKDGATLGKTAFVPSSLAGGNITQHVLRFPIAISVESSFVRLVVDSPHGQSWMRQETKGVALPGVNVGDFRRMPIPLPPLAEQKRIVARVEELLRWCDTLEAQLHQTRTLGAHLLDSTLHHLLAA